MLINWLIEAVKWKFLIKKLEYLKLKISFKAILCGITVCIFTPNRVGEYGGRVFFLKPENRIPAIFSTIVGSFSQLIITIIFGIISLCIFIYLYPEKWFFDYFNKGVIVVILTIIIMLIILIYLKISFLVVLIEKINFLKKFRKFYKILSEYSIIELIKIFNYSFFRYLIFHIQFFVLLKIFNVEISFIQSFVSVGLIYLVMAAIPTITITELGIRGSAAIFFIEMFSKETVGILSASMSLWLINLAVPALIGSVLFYKLKI